jgi:hypothetical protein
MSNQLLDERRRVEAAALVRVQRRVGAIGFFAIAVHGVLGVIGAAAVIDGQGRHTDAVLMTAFSGVISLIVYAVIRVILAARLWAPGWIVIALTPTVAGLVWII